MYMMGVCTPYAQVTQLENLACVPKNYPKLHNMISSSLHTSSSLLSPPPLSETPQRHGAIIINRGIRIILRSWWGWRSSYNPWML
mmetsp:Transcript_1501/g.2436  ORF Transcript_1501/g.2436 Transcript_1501/m.2436 type:complete len:85 (-) Transcript_1501:3805-4059(-)